MKILIKSRILLINDILAVDLDKINLHDDNCDEDDPDTIIHAILLAGVLNLENGKHFIRRTTARTWASSKIVEFFHVRR